jgi:hypothetical protein
MAGVLMGAAPIYIARFRQLAQGDIRPQLRREADEFEPVVRPTEAPPEAAAA